MLLVITFAFLAASLTDIETHYNKEFTLQYDTPGNYLLHPRDYKKAPTLFVAIHGAGGGASAAFYSIQGVPGSVFHRCTAQHGAYLTVLIDTRLGRRSFNIAVGKGGDGGILNSTSCSPNCKYNDIQATSGGDSSISLLHGKLWAEAKGGLNGFSGGTGPCTDDVLGNKQGYTNISFRKGIQILERQNGPIGYSTDYTYNISGLPGYGGRGTRLGNNCTYCQATLGNPGNNGQVRVIPVAVPIYMIGDEDIKDYDVDYFMTHSH